MKKSKFLKSSKDILSRSFNPSKCKTSLRLAGSRLKLLRNKKEAQVKQMKREIAQLLDSGQDQTARIRVEHVIREEKMMTAYDLIELYCELIVARLPIIETQKICPIDLKEAITSVVFASPRCGDVPELIDIKKQFTEKYGKEFITAAVELRPGCGVSRLVVEKLSAVAPDGQTKIKILSTIAEEHNVKWDPKSFSESSLPASDLLHGPSTFGEESKLHAEPSHFEGPVHQVPQSNSRTHDSPSNFTQVDNRTSLGANQSFQHNERPQVNQVPQSNSRVHDSPSHFTQVNNRTSSGVSQSFQHNARSQALDDEREKFFQGDSNSPSGDRQRWNMDFKDATAAAQAAAESAELASMAARAAADLSTRDRIVRQYSNESHYSDANVSNSRFSNGHPFEESQNRSSPEHTRSHNEHNRMQSNTMKTDGSFKNRSLDGRKESTQSASFKSQSSIDNNSLGHQKNSSTRKTDGSSKDRNLDGRKESTQSASLQSQASIDNYSGHQKNSKEVFRGGTSEQREKSENGRKERVGKQPSARSSGSHTSISNDVNIFSNSKDQTFAYGAGEDSFLVFGKKDIYEEASQNDSRESGDVVFDKSESDSENQGFDMSPRYDEPKQRLHLPLSGQKLHEHLSTDTGSWSPRSSTTKTVKSSSSLFLTRNSSSTDSSERHIDGSKLDDSGPMIFDQSDGPTSESDDDMNISRHPRISRDNSSTQNQSIGSTSESEEETNISRHPRVSRDFLSTQNQSIGSQFKDKNELLVGSSLKKGSPRFDRKQSPSKSEETEIERGLNFEKLTGGFRHKGLNHPPYLKNQYDVSSSSNQELEKNNPTIPKFTAPAVESPRMIESKKPRAPYLQPESDSEFSEEEKFLRKSPDHKQERYAPPAVASPGMVEHKKVRTPYLQPESDSDFSEEEKSLRKSPHHKQERYAPPAVASPRMVEHKKARTPYLHPESDSDFSEEEKSLRKSPDHKPERYASPAVESPRMVEHKKAIRKSPDHKHERYASPAVQSPRMVEHKKPRTPYLRPESDSDFSEEEKSLRRSPDHKQERHASTVGQNAKTKPSLAASTSIFGSDNSGSDENRPKESLSRYSHLHSGISRRTKAFPSGSGKLDYSKTQHTSEMPDSSDYMDRKATTTSTISETGKRPNSSKVEHSKQPTSRKEASKTIMEKQIPQTKQETKVTLESSTQQKKMGTSISREKPKVLDKPSSNKDQSASHVHPKLPDYDELVQLFQKNRS